jgi:hypothetical protein
VVPKFKEASSDSSLLGWAHFKTDKKQSWSLILIGLKLLIYSVNTLQTSILSINSLPSQSLLAYSATILLS